MFPTKSSIFVPPVKSNSPNTTSKNCIATYFKILLYIIILFRKTKHRLPGECPGTNKQENSRPASLRTSSSEINLSTFGTLGLANSSNPNHRCIYHYIYYRKFKFVNIKRCRMFSLKYCTPYI